MRKTMRGSFTIEAAVIVPIILWGFAVILLLLFYYHDKNVVTAVAYETAAMGCGDHGMSSEEMETYFQKRLADKMILFSFVNIEAKDEGHDITIFCKAQRNGMNFHVKISMKGTEPESIVRRLQWIEKGKEELGETE